jgi:hypothetical protein
MTSPIQPKDQLSIAAAHLARSAPKFWEEMIGAISVMAEKAMVDCMNAPGDRVSVAQGRAQVWVEIFDLFGDAIKRAAELDDKQRKAQTRG